MSPRWSLPEVSDDDLLAVEVAILDAFNTGSTSELEVLGMGELGLAIGWPSTGPRAVLKRQAPGPSLDADLDRMRRFHDALQRCGVGVLPTEIRTIHSPDGTRVPYLVQPIIDSHDLVENILADAEPDPNHPILESIRETVIAAVKDGPDGGQSIDAQVTNFAWDGESVVSIDTTPPLIWGPGEGPMHDVGNYLTAIPAPLRPVAAALTRKTGADYKSIRGVLLLTVAYLLRIDQERWVDAAMQCFNSEIQPPLTRPEVDEKFGQVVKDLPTIKRLARIERAWRTNVRRKRYEFFITNSFTGDVY